MIIDKSLTIRERILGKTHQNYAWPLDSLYSWFFKSNDFESAMKIIDEIISNRTEVLEKITII